jgi:hypothetical protein
MSYYIVESFEPHLTINGVALTGVPTTSYAFPIWHYVVNTDEEPENWPASPHGQSEGSPRRSPDGIKDWWVVTRFARARSNKRRSDCKPLDSLPSEYPVFDWPLAIENVILPVLDLNQC